MSETKQFILAILILLGLVLFALPVVMAAIRMIWAAISFYVRPFKFIGRWWDAAWKVSENVVQWFAKKRDIQEHNETYPSGTCYRPYCSICKVRE